MGDKVGDKIGGKYRGKSGDKIGGQNPGTKLGDKIGDNIQGHKGKQLETAGTKSGDKILTATLCDNDLKPFVWKYVRTPKALRCLGENAQAV